MRRHALLVTFCCTLGVVVSATTPALDSAQRTQLKTYIAANSDVNTPCVNGDLTEVARLLNLTASPAFWVWRTAVSRDEYLGSTSVDGTVFNYTGTGYITRAQGERDAFNALFDSAGMANPSRANVRQAVADIFSGSTAPAPANRTHLLTVSRRTALRIERVFATGTGSTATPGSLVIEGTIGTSELIGICTP